LLSINLVFNQLHKEFVKKTLKISIKVFLMLVASIILVFAGIIIFATINDYQPPLKEKLKLTGKPCYDKPDSNIISLFSWNIGYCGLGKEADFFYDGGKMMRPTNELFQKYLNGVMNFLAANDTVDVMFIQEVDTNARRSYYTNELKLVNEFLPLYQGCFAKNYDVNFVPFPLTNPMGSVISGMTTLSKIKMNEAWRYTYPASYSWPKKVFLLDRCLILSRIKLKNGKTLVLINTHNSAFDDAAEIREIEGYVLKSIMLDEYNRGNYVVVGGDWNRNPPGFDMNKLTATEAHRTWDPPLNKDFLPKEWTWVYQKDIPTNRDVITGYAKGKTKTTIIDYFVVSPNVKVIENKTIPTGFSFSDHQPIFMRIELMQDSVKKDIPSVKKRN
jgi:endonuclease/exonuclease/phosphatase family metal-dependent hydrolase